MVGARRKRHQWLVHCALTIHVRLSARSRHPLRPLLVQLCARSRWPRTATALRAQPRSQGSRVPTVLSPLAAARRAAFFSKSERHCGCCTARWAARRGRVRRCVAGPAHPTLPTPAPRIRCWPGRVCSARQARGRTLCESCCPRLPDGHTCLFRNCIPHGLGLRFEPIVLLSLVAAHGQQTRALGDAAHWSRACGSERPGVSDVSQHFLSSATALTRTESFVPASLAPKHTFTALTSVHTPLLTCRPAAQAA